LWKGRREDEESPPALSRWAAKTSYDGLPSPSVVPKPGYFDGLGSPSVVPKPGYFDGLGSPSYNRAVLKRQIDATDRQIDRLVYELYELTAEEIAIVEGAACS